MQVYFVLRIQIHNSLVNKLVAWFNTISLSLSLSQSLSPSLSLSLLVVTTLLYNATQPDQFSCQFQTNFHKTKTTDPKQQYPLFQ